jgi:dienelactone hydrolase
MRAWIWQGPRIFKLLFLAEWALGVRSTDLPNMKIPALSILLPALAFAVEPLPKALDQYFRDETARIAGACLADVHTAADWQAQRTRRREELREMLGLLPWPERGDLKATTTGRIEREDFIVEKVHFQSLPGLYVTGNLYLPRDTAKPVPAILYACGHSPMMENGVSLGNKTDYQHHGEWFARNGYACLAIDTVQLGEIQGIHHGTYKFDRWWWNSRGYTPAGVECWNCIRALDYLETRREIDRTRIGMTGRSGGGSYTWTTAALDDRIRAAAPVAGITDLENQVVDGCVEGHCDCMFFVNTYRWDFPLFGALIAPRPLLIVNSDADTIFPLDGVERLHTKVRRIYDLLGAPDKLGLVIAPGPHKDTQDLQIPVFRWFNQHLRGEDPVIEMAATRLLPIAQLRVFSELPKDEINSRIDESFVPAAKGKVDASVVEVLRTKVFGGWPSEPELVQPKPTREVVREGVRLRSFDFSNARDAGGVMFVLDKPLTPQHAATLQILDDGSWANWHAAVAQRMPGVLPDLSAGEWDLLQPGADAVLALEDGITRSWLAPRGIGPTAWGGDARQQIQIRRRFMLLGQTLDGMRVWDICRGAQALALLLPADARKITIRARGPLAIDALHAALFQHEINTLELAALPKTAGEMPDFLNIARYLELSDVLDLVRARISVEIAD